MYRCLEDNFPQNLRMLNQAELSSAGQRCSAKFDNDSLSTIESCQQVVPRRQEIQYPKNEQERKSATSG